MIAVDSSVVVAIMRHELDARMWTEVLDRTDAAIMSVVSYVEASMVIAGRRPDADVGSVERLLQSLQIEIVPVTIEQGAAALNAFMSYGKGRHGARLNFGDCFSYALAKSRNLPLLFKGQDFSYTDITPAWIP